MNRDNIANFIKDQRTKVGMTQQDLAEVLCTSRENISKWERGLAIPNTEYLKPLCKALKVPITDLLAGKIASNEDDASNIIYDIIDNNQKIKKRFFKIMIITILISVFSFLAYYFIDNYNSIKLYTINCDNDGYQLENGLLLVLKDKGYFIFNSLNIPKDEELKNVKLYFYDKNNEKIVIHDSSKINSITKIEFDLSKLDELLNNTYLEIITDKNTSKIKLEVRNKYKNNELFDNIEQNNDPALNHEFYFDNYEFPSLKEFKYNESEKIYTYQKGEVKIEYYPHIKNANIIASKDKNKYIITFLNNNSVLYNYNQHNEQEKICYYNYKEKQVIKGECQNYIEKLEILIQKYLNFIS